MNKIIIITLFLILLLGGTVEAGLLDFFSGIVDKVKEVFGFKSLCEEPQIFRGGECCLDLNGDNECDEGLDSLTEEEINEFISNGGPGGCKGKECQGFCSSKENREECKSWCKENPILCEAFEDRKEEKPSKIFSDKKFTKLEKKEIFKRKELQVEDKIKDESVRKDLPCDSEEECKMYCIKNPKECGYDGSGKFETQMNKEEIVYCMEHPEECKEKFKDERNNREPQNMYCKSEEECKKMYETYRKDMPDCNPEEGCQDFSTQECEGENCDEGLDSRNMMRDYPEYEGQIPQNYPQESSEFRCDSPEECQRCMDDPESCRV